MRLGFILLTKPNPSTEQKQHKICHAAICVDALNLNTPSYLFSGMGFCDQASELALPECQKNRN